MSATYTDWNQVPAHIERKIRLIWNGDGCATWDKGWDGNNDPVTIYKLSDYKVAHNLAYLTDAQRVKLFDVAVQSNCILSNLVHALSFEPECVRVKDEIYHVPGIVVGTWPHCKLYGGMDEGGHIHT